MKRNAKKDFKLAARDVKEIVQETSGKVTKAAKGLKTRYYDKADDKTKQKIVAGVVTISGIIATAILKKMMSRKTRD